MKKTIIPISLFKLFVFYLLLLKHFLIMKNGMQFQHQRISRDLSISKISHISHILPFKSRDSIQHSFFVCFQPSKSVFIPGFKILFNILKLLIEHNSFIPRNITTIPPRIHILVKLRVVNPHGFKSERIWTITYEVCV